MNLKSRLTFLAAIANIAPWGASDAVLAMTVANSVFVPAETIPRSLWDTQVGIAPDLCTCHIRNWTCNRNAQISHVAINKRNAVLHCRYNHDADTMIMPIPLQCCFEDT